MLRTYKFPGLSVAKSDGGWLASYQNSVGKHHEIGIFADEEKAARAGFLWMQGFRFDAMRAEYEAGKTLRDILEKWRCHESIAHECIVIAGGVVRNFWESPKRLAGKKIAPKTALEAALSLKMTAVRSFRRAPSAEKAQHGAARP